MPKRSSSPSNSPNHLAQAQIADLFRHPAWPHLQAFLQERAQTARRQLELMDPNCNQTQMARYQGRLELIKELDTSTTETKTRLACSIGDFLSR